MHISLLYFNFSHIVTVQNPDDLKLLMKKCCIKLGELHPSDIAKHQQEFIDL